MEVLLGTTVAVAMTATVDVGVGSESPIPRYKEVAVVVDEVSDEVVSALAEEDLAEEAVFAASELDFDRTGTVVAASKVDFDRTGAVVDASALVEATAVLQSA
jgi:hypothetical protein